MPKKYTIVDTSFLDQKNIALQIGLSVSFVKMITNATLYCLAKSKRPSVGQIIGQALNAVSISLTHANTH